VKSGVLAALLLLPAALVAQNAELHVMPIRGNVFMVVGGESNVTVSAGVDGVLVVDAGTAAMADKTLAVINEIDRATAEPGRLTTCVGPACYQPGSLGPFTPFGWAGPSYNAVIASPRPPKPIRWILQTTADPEHTGGTAKLALAGKTYNGGEAGRLVGDVTPATVVIIPEYKEPDPAIYERGLKLFTVHVRRGDPAVQDQKLNSHSKLNCILASIQATQAGADEGLMLDPHGFVATCNSTHFFIVRKGEVWTSSGKYCLGGITRGIVIELCRDNGIPVFEKDFSLTDVHGADEAFVTGTFAGVVPVREVDGRKVTEGRGPMAERLQQLYLERVERDVTEQQRP